MEERTQRSEEENPHRGVGSDSLEELAVRQKQEAVGLVQRNEELEVLTQRLKEKLKLVQDELNLCQQKQQNVYKKRVTNRAVMTKHIYAKLMEFLEGPGYLKVRLRLAFCLLAVTGIRIGELLPLRVNQIKTLATEYWIFIDRRKSGSCSNKAFLNAEGKRIVKERSKDFKVMFLLKKPDSFIFTSELNHDKSLTREALTRDVNRVMRTVSKQLPGEPNITSFSFRIGYINSLWEDWKDIEFVKQTIGHRNLDTTSAYVNKLSDQERQNRINQLE